MVEEIGCEELLQKPVTRSTLRLLLARIHVDCTTPSATALQQSPQQLAGCHLLYAEDSLPSQKIVKRILEKAGAKCTVVDNGKKAVETVLNDPATIFDCILMVGHFIELMLVFINSSTNQKRF
jgi:PleD family two-component response regulator